MIQKAVIPAAGKGTRVSKLRGTHPKECLEVMGLPMITLALLELARAGLAEVAVVVSPEKTELGSLLRGLPRFPTEAQIARLYPVAPSNPPRRTWPRIVQFEQREPRGVLDAVSKARSYIENEPFALVMPDNLLVGGKPPLDVLGEAFGRHGKPVLGLAEISRAEAGRQGNCGWVELEPLHGAVHRIAGLRPKGSGVFRLPAGARRVKRAVGRSIVPPDFPDLAERRDLRGEIDDVPAFRVLASRGRLLGVELGARLYDLGQERGLVAARLAFEYQNGGE